MGVSKKELLERIEKLEDQLATFAAKVTMLEMERPLISETNRLRFLKIHTLAEALGYEFKELPATEAKIVCQKKGEK